MKMRSHALVPLLFAVSMVTSPALLFAQTGTISGRVVDDRTMAPLPAQVSVTGAGIGVLSGSNGRFLLQNVPAGTHELRVELIGYRTVTRQVEVRSGETAVVDVQLSIEALALDEVVVTGTAGGTQRRAVGNVVERLPAPEILAITGSRDVTQLIGQRTPGVVMLGGTGGVGVGSRIRIRGAGSMGLPNDPIIYIDGIRMDSNPESGPTQRGGAKVNRLNDINPDDIESIEIIKGPAAATLYGTEASSGVVQIITKRGNTGAPQFDLAVRVGTNWLWDPAGRQGLTWARDPNSGQLLSFNVYEYERENGLGDIFSYGALQSYQGNLSGGTDAVRYFVSASWSDETGVRPENWDQRLNLRANLDLNLTEQLSLSTSMGYIQGKTRLANGGFNNDPFSNIYWASPLPTRIALNRGYFRAPPEEWVKIEQMAEINRYIGSFQLRYNPFEWLANRLVIGLDTNEDRDTNLTPRQPQGNAHFFGNDALGVKQIENASNRFVTVDYGGTVTRDLSERLQSVTSVGLQYYRTRRLTIGSTGNNLPAPQMTTVSAAAIRAGTETFEENATLGAFVQQQFGWQNRLFLTAAVRADDNSAFGAEFDAAIYPKFSATWVLHEEPFFNVGWVNQLRLRGAWGAAGRQPGTFDAAQLLSPQIGFGDQPTLVPSSFGNPQLKPERGEELELGFDAELFNGRLGLVYTRFERQTKDAIVSRPLPRSLGWPGSQIVNLGLVKGWGNEVALDVRVIDGSRFSWDLGTQFSTYRNRIEDLGGLRNIGNHYVGYSIQDLYYQTVVHAEVDANGRLTTLQCDGGTGPIGVDRGGAPVSCTGAPLVRWGHTQPTWDVGVNSSFNVGPVRLYARVDAVGGHYQQDSSSPANITSNVLTYLSNTREDPFVEAYKVVPRGPLGTYKGDFARLREVSAQYNLPEAITRRVGASSGSITLAGRNLMMLWTAEHGWGTPRSGLIRMPIGDGHTWDPETRGQGDLSTNHQTVMPPLTSASLSVRFRF